jgi:NAD(P)-dependent dehydrogenase (short-subunit alcohol dehydrogenase family)
VDRLKDKVAVITGGSSGIGRGAVEKFVAEGAKVLVGDIDDAAGRELESLYGPQVAYQHCDVLHEDQIKALMDGAVERWGQLDVVFNNAGAGGSGLPISEIDGDGWDFSHQLLLRSVALGIRYAVPHMKARGKGSIINTASIAGLEAGRGPIAYSVMKAAVIHLSRLSAAELGRDGIRVNAICPGLILTNIFTPLTHMPEGLAREIKESMAQRAPDSQPIGKAGVPEDTANAVLFFASDESAFVTGVHMLVDGGMYTGPRHAWDPVMRAERNAERDARRAAFEAAEAGDRA